MKQMARWGVLPLLAAPVGAWALGLGDIQLQSALDQPLRAQIRLSATKDEIEGLDIGLADRATFQRYGLDRPAFLSTLKFTVTKDGAGHNIILVTSPEPINEPFVTMLLQATWPKGRSLREYTMLLDPPVFGSGNAAPVREAQTRPAQSAPSAAASGAIARPRAAERQAAVSATAPAASSAAQPQAQAEARNAAPAGAAAGPRLGGTYGPVQRSETLWNIAAQVKPTGATMNQTLVALYAANPRAFEGNMNLLRRGATLKIPSGSAIGNVSAANAVAEVRRQTDQWRARAEGQQASAGASAGGQGGHEQARLRLEAPSTSSGTAAGNNAAAAVGAAGAAGGAAAAGTSGGSATAGNAGTKQLQSQVDQLQSQLKESRRLLQVRDQQLRDLQQQLSKAKSAGSAAASSAANAGQTSAGAQLEPDQVFAAGQKGAQNKAAQSGNAGAQSAQAAASAANQSAPPAQPPTKAQAAPQTPPPAAAETPAPKPAAAVARHKVVATTSAPAPSMLSRVIGALARPFVLIGIGVAALLLTALWFLRRRGEEVEDVTGRWEALEAEVDADHIDHETTERLRRQADSKDFIVEESQPATEHERPSRAAEPRPAIEPRAAAAGAADSGATGKFEAPSLADETLSSQTVINLDQADPIAEADFHMAYGLYDQAAELVTQAIEKDPANRGLQLKLLEVFFVWGNKEAFLDAAKAFRAEVGEAVDQDWDKVIIMGKQICPDDPLFADATAGASEVDVDLDAGDGAEPALDFAFDDHSAGASGAAGEGADAGVDLDLGSSDDDSIDLQLEGTGDRESRLGGDDDHAYTASDDALDIGEATQAGLEEALFGLDGDDTGRRTTPNVDVDALAETQESPTVETPQSGLSGTDFSALTVEESPTVESRAASDESPTVESSAIHGDDDEAAAFGLFEEEDEEAGAAADYSADAPTVETPTVESSAIRSGDADAPTVETPTVETAYTGGSEATVETAFGGAASEPAESADHDMPAELTAEIDLDDLGLDVEDLQGLPEDIGELPSSERGETDTREQPALDTDDELLSATGVTQVLGETGIDLGETGTDMEYANTSVLGDADATMLAQAPDEGTLSRTEVLQHQEDPAEQTGLQRMSDIDVNLDDFDAALGGGDTVEQPRIQSFASDVFGGNGQTPVDLDVGSDFNGSDDPTGTEDIGALDPQTMTEVGTKLDLARAYIDMGDPEGARSILEEVLDEGDAGQKREAQSLIEVLTA